LVWLGLLILVVVAVARTNYGVWNAPLPLQDEAHYIKKSYELYQSGDISSSLYLNTYALVFRYLTSDPITAHYVVRFLASLLSTIGLFLFLSFVPQVNLFGAFALSLFWSLNLLNTPVVQTGNVNLFAFGLACLASVFWLGNWRSLSKWFGLAILMVAALIRPEYGILVALLGFRVILRWIRDITSTPLAARSRRLTLRDGIAISCILVLAGAFLVYERVQERVIGGMSYADNYLFLGLNQCYTAFSTRDDPHADFDPMTEYEIVMEKRFPGARGFIDAFMINPSEIIRYFVLNGWSNLSKLYRVVKHNSILLPGNLGDTPNRYSILRIEWAISFLFVVLTSIRLLWRLINESPRVWWKQLWTDDRVYFLVGLAMVSAPAIFLLIPEPRYWITIIPLLFWGPAAFVSKLAKSLKGWTLFGMAVAGIFVMANPAFPSSLILSSSPQKELILSFREKLAGLEKEKIEVLGRWVDPLCTFAAPGRCKSTNIWDIPKGLPFESVITSKSHDLILIDGALRVTRRYKLEKPFFDSFIERPEGFGYQLLLEGGEKNTMIFLRIE
jgi:hypothetical protein